MKGQKMGLFNFLRKAPLADCGHVFKKKGTMTAFGESAGVTVPIVDGKTPHCHRCLEKMAIQCAWCGKTIFIGEPVTLYTPTKEDFEVPEHAVIYNKDPLQLVGCLGWDCAETGGDRAGFWYPPGEVKRVESPIEAVLRTGKAVFYHDLTDPNGTVGSS